MYYISILILLFIIFLEKNNIVFIDEEWLVYNYVL